MGTVLWYAKQGTVYINGAALGTVSTESSLLDQFTAGTGEIDVTAHCKEIRITGGDMDAEAIDLFGANQELEEKRPSLITLTARLIYQDANDSQGLLRNVTLSTVLAGYTRYQGGEAANGNRTKKAYLVTLTNSNASTGDPNMVTILLNNALQTSRELTFGVDGHAEEVITVKCLAKDYYEEFTTA